MHDADDVSFDVWCNDLKVYTELDEEYVDEFGDYPLHVEFLHAAFAMHRAGRNLEKAFQQS